VTLRLRFVVSDRDRHGNVRYYFRRRGEKKVRLHGIPGSKEFMEAYSLALASVTSRPATGNIELRSSFGFLCKEYFRSQTFKALNVSTRLWRRRVLEEICERHGEKPYAKLQPKNVRSLRDEKANAPGAANTRLKGLRALFRWAIENDFVVDNPTRGVEPIRYVTDGYHSWTVDEVETFEARHPIGSKARLAFALMLYTGCRRGDAVRLGPQHVHEGRLRYRQQKNEGRHPIDIDIPVHADLAEVISATPSGHLNFLVTDFGKPFSVAGFGNKFREWCNQAELPNCSAHGLRKALAVRLAEGGATPHEIMSITGHLSLDEVERYTRGANTRRLANSAMEKIK
jgi:integrase/recombinase XerD